MSRIKKILAVLVTLAMVIVMAVPAFAETKTKTEATITVNNAGNAALTYFQLIKPERSSATGWKFVNPTVANHFQAAFEVNTDDAVINALIQTENGNNSSELAKALDSVAKDNTIEFQPMKNPQTVNVAGVYAIKGSEEGYVYNNMAAYVGFGEVTITNDGATIKYDYPSLLDTTVDAKKTPTGITKGSDDGNAVVQIGQIVKYTVNATVPYIPANDTDKTFKITDAISGAAYYLEGTDSVNSVKMGDTELVDNATYGNGNIEIKVNGSSFEIDLGCLINNTNSNAGKSIVVTYTAKVTGTEVKNTAVSHVGGSTYSSEEVKLYTGKITLTKYASDNDNDNLTDNETLADAKFIVYKENGDSTKSYAKFDANKFVEWISDEGTATQIVTGSDGTVTVEGLDLGTYYFKEFEAPEGYSKNTTDVSAVLALTEGQSKATAIVVAGTHMIDTKLSALPSTGGIGTTIFTVGGCLIMIAAAALFFTSRKKAFK